MTAQKRLFALTAALLMLLSLFTPAFAAEQTESGIRNVIFMIGDGMGENHLALAREQGVDLFMDTACDLRGQSETRSFSSKVTDSAAGATALSCGVRVNNRALCVYPIDPLGVFVRPRIITENAIEHGMRTGIVTTDRTTGATPAGYSVHISDRGESAQITKRQLESDLDLIWGAAAEEDARAAAEEQGWTYVEDAAGMNALTAGQRSFGQFSGEFWRARPIDGGNMPTLAEMSVKAIGLLNENNTKGFFLMIEGAHIDKNSHRTEEGVDFPAKIADTTDAMRGFDDAIRAAVEFARADGHTLVVVTADHETGDLYLENGRYTFHSGSHTGKNVPLLVYGADDLFAPGEAVKNSSVPGRVAAKLGWSASELPCADPGLFPLALRRFFGKAPARSDGRRCVGAPVF